MSDKMPHRAIDYLQVDNVIAPFTHVDWVKFNQKEFVQKEEFSQLSERLIRYLFVCGASSLFPRSSVSQWSRLDYTEQRQ